MTPWYKKIPCWFGKHDWVYGHYRDPEDGKEVRFQTCKYCERRYITWANWNWF